MIQLLVLGMFLSMFGIPVFVKKQVGGNKAMPEGETFSTLGFSRHEHHAVVCVGIKWVAMLTCSCESRHVRLQDDVFDQCGVQLDNAGRLADDMRLCGLIPAGQ
jgi:hypothetical protein